MTNYVYADSAFRSAQRWETIAPDYTNVVGFNYIATYHDIRTALSLDSAYAAPPGVGSITDVASPVAMWVGFDNSTARGSIGNEVRAQLQRIKEVGANTIRIWLSYHLYSYSPSDMRSKFNDFLTMCDRVGLYVIPVLWDADFVEPDSTSIQGTDFHNYKNWVSSPGSALIRGGSLPHPQDSYVHDMVMVAWNAGGCPHQSLLMWDVMNEPDFELPDHKQLVMNTLALIKTLPGAYKTSVSPAIWNYNSAHYQAVACDPHLDVLGTHFYGSMKLDVQGRCANAHASLPRLLRPSYKPIIVNEAGYTAYGATYSDVINLCSNVPSAYTGNTTARNGVGFCLFQAYVGNPPNPRFPTGRYPFIYSDGLLYNPHYDIGHAKFARDLNTDTSTQTTTTALAIAALFTRRHPTTPMVPLSLRQMTNPNQAGYVLQYPEPVGFGRTNVSELLSRPLLDRSCWPIPDYPLHVGGIIEALMVFSFQWFGSFEPANNPFYDPRDAQHENADARALKANYAYFVAWRTTPSNPSPPFPAGVTIESVIRALHRLVGRYWLPNSALY